MDPLTESLTLDALPKRPSRLQIAFVLSVVFHLLLLLGFYFWYVPSRNESDLSDASTEPNNATMVPVRDVIAEHIEKSIEVQIEESESKTNEEKLSGLDKNLERLHRISDDATVDQVSAKIAATMGIDREQYAEKPERPDGEFDVSSAQIESVKRTQDEKGNWNYEAVLVDQEGRKSVTPMNRDEGQTLYDAFEKIKQYPMAEGIYRQLVMPLIQKMLEAEK